MFQSNFYEIFQNNFTERTAVGDCADEGQPTVTVLVLVETVLIRNKNEQWRSHFLTYVFQGH